MFNMLLIFNFFMNFFFLLSKTPPSMGLILMIQIIVLSLILSTMTFNYWFSFILFIVMIGGLMVLFIYMTSMIPNSIHKINWTIILYTMILFFSISMTSYLMNFNLLFNKNSLESISSLLLFKNNYFYLNKMYNFPLNYLLLLSIIYLLLTLIIAAKLVKSSYGSIRQI
uniref:NADH-ubiquinone oxidoreductase chain 6 n=1 Tax=Coniopteryx sp. YW-2016 TaxID=1821761 RepID=A0A1S5QYC8_9NEOP|nr:NADH dehydrogenase subunit 6 [Coniopteryx sp. YW-2016]